MRYYCRFILIINQRTNDMRVYHLLSEKYAKENLEKQRLKVSRFADLNDPFELLSVELEKNVRRKFKQWKKGFNEKYGVLCFSRSWKNPVLWSHYADKHKGICLGFDVPDNLLKEVKYELRRLSIKIGKDGEKGIIDEDIIENLLCTKFRQWNYENEERIIVPLSKAYQENDLYFVCFDDNLKLKEVVVGAQCNTKKAELEKLILANLKDVEFIKARLAFKTFRVVRNNKQGFKYS